MSATIVNTEVGSVYDFCDRTLTIGYDIKFGLEINSLYRIYLIYCSTLELQPVPLKTFVDQVRDTFPYSFKMVRTAYKYIPDIACLQGLTYVNPKPWADGNKVQRYYLSKTSTGNIDRINLRVSNGNMPTDIPEYWPDFARLCKIRSGNKIVIFSPYDYQVKVWELMEEARKVTIVKSRQLGITQIQASIFLHRACLNPAYSAAIFSRRKSDTTNVARRTRVMVKSLRFYLSAEQDSASYLKIKGGGDIHYMTADDDGTRSLESVSDTLYDEAGFVHNIESIVAASGASSLMVGDSATRIVCSTPNTKYGWFYDQLADGNPEGFDFDAVCEGVVNQTLDPFFIWQAPDGTQKAIIHWRAHPIYRAREDFVRERMVAEGITMEKAQREYNLQFENSEVTVFHFSHVAGCMTGQYETEPSPDSTYYMGIDTASIGQNYTVAYILEEFKVPNPAAEVGSGQQLNAYKVVADYRRNRQMHSTDMQAIAALVRKWKPSKIGVETFDGTGEITAQKLIELFPQIPVVKIKSKDESKACQVSMLSTCLEERRLIYPPGALANELTVYSLIQGKYQAPSKKNDDCVSAILMALTVTPFNYGDFRLVMEIPRDDQVGVMDESSTGKGFQLVDVRELMLQ
jgi:Terminase RNaseH-like domain